MQENKREWVCKLKKLVILLILLFLLLSISVSALPSKGSNLKSDHHGYKKITADFLASPTSGSVPLKVQFIDNSSGNPRRRLWNFGDGSNSTLRNPSHNYTQAGTYTVTLTAINAAGNNTTTKPNYIFVNAYPPVAKFTSSPTYGNAPLTVTFTDQSTESPTSWSWNFGDGSAVDATKSPTHIFTTAGTFTVTLTASNANGANSNSAQIVVSPAVVPAPVAAFTASATTGTAPATITFNDQSTGSPTSWSWNFGDGSAVDTTKSPTHVFTTAGTFTVTLTASNANGANSNSAQIVVSPAVVPAPVAAFTASATTGTAPATITFNDQSIGSPTSWSWNFGDGSTSTLQNPPAYTYTQAGTYTISLTVSNAYGSNTSVKSSLINISSATAIVADFNSNVTTGKTPLIVQFNDISTGNPTTWNWDFGDGTISTQQNPMHTYLAIGAYTVTLRASSSTFVGAVTKTNYITVENGLQAVFTASPSQGEVPLNVQFTDTSIGAPTAWLWDFGDGTNSILQSPAHIYNLAGNYTVKLTASNNIGSNTSAIPSIINVSSAISQFVSTPVASFYSNVTSGNAPLPVQFTDTSTGNVTSWLWDFGDGNTSASQNSTHTYFEPGSYSVTLNASNTDNYSVLTLPGYITVTGDSGSSSSGGGGSVSTVTGSLAGAGGSPEPASNVAVKLQTQAYIAAGNHIKFEFTKGATCIDCVEFDAKRTLGKTTTTVEQLKERSVLAPTGPDGKVYKYLNIWVGNSGIATPENIENATVKFVISKAEIEMNETEEPKIVLQWYEQGMWNPLNTSKMEEDEQYIHYQAKTSGFSTFAITSDEIKPIEENVSQPNEKNVSRPILNNELSIQSKQPGKSEAVNNTDWSKYSGVIRFFILFIVVLFIGLALKEKRK